MEGHVLNGISAEGHTLAGMRAKGRALSDVSAEGHVLYCGSGNPEPLVTAAPLLSDFAGRPRTITKNHLKPSV